MTVEGFGLPPHYGQVELRQLLHGDLLEPALAARLGRGDVAVEVGLPDAAGRRRLLELYGRGVPCSASRAVPPPRTPPPRTPPRTPLR